MQNPNHVLKEIKTKSEGGQNQNPQEIKSGYMERKIEIKPKKNKREENH